MAYTKTTWQNNVTDIDANNLNKIEQGIYDNSLIADAVTNTLNPRDTETYKTAELTEGQITDVIGVSDIVIKGQTSQNGEPTLSSPVDVNVVSGNNTINTSNKNLLDISNLTTRTTANVNITNNGDGSFTLNGTSSSNGGAVDIPINIPLKNNTTYTYSKTTKTNVAFFAILLYNSSQQAIVSLDSGSTSTSFTPQSDVVAKSFKIYFAPSKTYSNHTIYPMLEVGSTATTYEPHQGKELPLDLGNIELCKIGDYQDYFYKSGSKWYLHKEIGKITSYNGETITTSYISTTGKLSKGAKVYYVVNSTDTKITNTTLISQLEAIYNAPLYEQTNITQTNNDLPMVLDITACKDNINGIKAFIRK